MKYSMKSKRMFVILLAVFTCFCMSGCYGYIIDQPLVNMPINGSFICEVGPAKGSRTITYVDPYCFDDVRSASRIVLNVNSSTFQRVGDGYAVPCTVELDRVILGTIPDNTYASLRVTYSGLEYDTEYLLRVDGRFEAYNDSDVLVAYSDNLTYINDNGATEAGRLYLTTTSQPESSQEDTSTHVHNYAWVRTKEPTLNEDGVSSLICSECGDVQQTIPINNDMVVYESFANELEKQIKTAEEGATLKLDMNAWHSVPSFLMERIISCGRDVELTYKYQGVLYDITIKAGQGQNLNIPWYGPLLMNSLYGN